MNKYVLSIDAGTTGITLVLLDKSGTIVNKEYSEFTQIYPQPGWVEHNPEEIWKVTLSLLRSTFDKFSSNSIVAIGITNQRETTILWDRCTGKPVYNAIVWQCRRTQKECEELKNQNLDEKFQDKTGLVIDCYFSGTKIKWILDNVEGVRIKSDEGNICFGTVDSWLLWKLTGGKVHSTDFTNASRTMIFNIDEKKWDNELLDIFGIPESILPSVHPSSYNFGETISELTKSPIPIAGIAGDQQAALFGQGGFYPGSIKNTYGTGCFLLINTGKQRKKSNAGLLNTLVCDETGNPVYGIEGSVFIAGAVIQWLRDELGIIKTPEETEKSAKKVSDNGGVYIVPAFVGLGSPYWNMDVRGMITGLTRGTNQNHIIRAALESIAYQVKDLLLAIEKDTTNKIDELLVDGGAVANSFLMQFQADILQVPVNKPINIETTATGAGFLAGLATGFWQDSVECSSARKIDKIYSPNMEKPQLDQLYNGWLSAVEMLISTSS